MGRYQYYMPWSLDVFLISHSHMSRDRGHRQISRGNRCEYSTSLMKGEPVPAATIVQPQEHIQATVGQILAPSPPVDRGAKISGDVPFKRIKFVLKGKCSSCTRPCEPVVEKCTYMKLAKPEDINPKQGISPKISSERTVLSCLLPSNCLLLSPATKRNKVRFSVPGVSGDIRVATADFPRQNVRGIPRRTCVNAVTSAATSCHGGRLLRSCGAAALPRRIIRGACL